MECLLCGVTSRLEEMIRYISLCGHGFRVERVEEVVYTLLGYTLIWSQEKVVYTSEISGCGEEGESSYLKVIFPADKSKSRKSLTRRVIRNKVWQAEGLIGILEGIGCQDRRERSYTRKVYGFKGAEVIIVQKENEQIVVVRAQQSQDGEAVLEEVKAKLSIWIDLIIPPEGIWPLLF
ncbi:hypothetical protein NEHOM01_0502 [Nematocida homosporus]|uniref:uncharacterized protein n=1 Tax=Nematocida homosporus TaxID=1912981 RepID=UPI00221FAAC3|nr:uncharacterized protein NEHOM01_0502 [Nematocida homosporus]KAI5184951.1 hypothetical protein NEHOM01_0502 [Nematocida homosporus]